MIVLGRPELADGYDLGDDWRRPLARLVDPRLHSLRRLPLLIGVVEDRRAVRGADVVPLAIERRWVVHAEEIPEQLLVGEYCRVEDYLDRFGVAGVARVDLGIRRLR